MIRINVEKIDKWEEIKEEHCKYVRDAVTKELSNLYVTKDVYTKKRKENNSPNYKTYYELDKTQREEIEELFGGEFRTKGSRTTFMINNEDKIKHISTGNLEEIISTFSQASVSKKVIERIFNYERFCNSTGWNRHHLVSMLRITVCPYCNRQYITNFKSKETGDTKTTADLDHFYSQNDYPYLALSLYNFIPSCQICNSRFKLKKNFKNDPHIYPYNEEFSEYAKFKTKGDTIDYLLGTSTDFEIYIDVKDSKFQEKIRNSIKTFNLKEVYQTHTDYVKEIIKKHIIYSESKIEEILFEFPDLFVSKDEIYRTIFGNYITNDELGKRPLSKLTKDICEELGLKFGY